MDADTIAVLSAGDTLALSSTYIDDNDGLAPRNCGVQVCQIPHGPPQHEVDAMPEGLKAVISEKLNLKPLNVRVFDDINMETLNIKRSNEGTEGYEMNVLDLQSAMSIEMSE